MKWFNLYGGPERTYACPFGVRSLGKQEIGDIKEKLERLLLRNIIPFWYPRVLDLVEGGYRMNHDFSGRWNGPANKRLVAQARTLWFFSRLLQTQYARAEFAEAAKHGFAFLAHKMWDDKFGGFYWEVSPAGDQATMPQKYIYGQAFALYGISEYAAATGDDRGRELAGQLFKVMDSLAHDESHGGYKELLGREWNPEPTGARWLSSRPNSKTMNAHLHLLEAFARYLAISNDSLTRQRLTELLVIQSSSVLRKVNCACTDLHHDDWRPFFSPVADRVSFGHNLENIHLLVEASQELGLPNGPLLDLYRALSGYSIRYGFDKRNGGFYYSGPLNKRADKLEKVWWVQAECLLGLLEVFYLTGEEALLMPLLRTLDWIMNHQADWERGEWYETITPGGSAGGLKAGPWKCPYHTGRAVIRSLDLLNSLATDSSS